MMLPLFAALVLLPQPRTVTELGGACAPDVVPTVVRDATVPPEGYRLTVEPAAISIASSDEAGAFYARQTLAQLLSTNGYACVRIVDAPAFRWRGFMLDEGRHFFGKEVVKSVLDRMASFKLNVFHWHLTEDQGWRVDLPKCPELAKYGAVRRESVTFGHRGIIDHGGKAACDLVMNGEPYGPYFYSPGDIAEILAYARARHITVVPEFEVPGHVRALLAAHPEFACRPNLPREPKCTAGIELEVLCVGNDEALAFIERVYDEFCALFPDAYIHIGGDECPRARWKDCPKCQARIKALGLSGEDRLQAWLTDRLCARLAKKGRRAIGWDEVLAGNPGTGTIVQTWHDRSAEAAKRGHDVIVSEWRTLYFSLPQGLAEDPYAYLARGMNTPLEKVYAFDPLQGVPEAQRAHIIGSECCLWSECCYNRFDLEFKIWPRALAFAEIVWTAPRAPRDFGDFSRRAGVLRRRLIADHVNCAPLR